MMTYAIFFVVEKIVHTNVHAAKLSNTDLTHYIQITETKQIKRIIIFMLNAFIWFLFSVVNCMFK